jgi:hypothetical protein
MSRRRSRAVLAAIVASILASLPPAALAQAPAPVQAPTAPADEGGLEVAVTYSGKGEVSRQHEISIFLFTDPNITAGSMPVAVGTVDENSGAFRFTGLPPVVYIAVVYDDTGNYEREGPPPPGTPIFLHGMAAGAPEGVKPGKDAKVTVTFDDSNRM